MAAPFTRPGLPRAPGQPRCALGQPAGGLTSALDPVMQACHGTWVAWGGSADRQAVDAQDHVQVPPHNPNTRCGAYG